MISERVRRDLVTLKEISGMLDIPYSTLANRLGRGQFPAPTRALPVGRRLYYSRQDAIEIVKAYGDKEAK